MSELTTLFKNTADAIRSKTGDTATMQASQFPAKIQGISVGISQDEADARYLQLSGGTMTGGLILNGAPTADNQAATKAYVDSKGGATLIHQETINIPSGSSNKNYQMPVSALSAILTSNSTHAINDVTHFILEAKHTNRSNIKLKAVAGTTLNYKPQLGTPVSRFLLPISVITTAPSGSSYQLGNVEFSFTYTSMISCNINATTAQNIPFQFECNSTSGDTLTCKFYLM